MWGQQYFALGDTELVNLDFIFSLLIEDIDVNFKTKSSDKSVNVKTSIFITI